jgi:dsDNA-specific endonuclease/ATPase MutS2
MVLSLKLKHMSRLKQNRIIDNAINSIASITESQCSLSETDVKVVDEAVTRLQRLKRKKGKTNEQIRQEISAVVFLIIKLFAIKGLDETELPNQ